MPQPAGAYVQVRGLTFHYRDWGGQGRPLVLLHGLASNARFWDLTAPHLAEVFRTVALDQRGHGASAKPDHGYDFSTIAGDIAGVIGALGLRRPIVVGHSWGGNIAVHVAADYPRLVSGIVCIDGGFFEPSAVPGATWEGARVRLAPPDFAALDLTWEQLVERARTWPTGPYWGERVVDFLHANFDVIEGGRVRPKLTRERHMRIVRAIWDQRVSELCPRLTCPVLLMPARRKGHQAPSAWVSAEEREGQILRLHGLLPRGRLVWMEDSIHDVPVQRPAEVARAIIQATQEGFFGEWEEATPL